MFLCEVCLNIKGAGSGLVNIYIKSLSIKIDIHIDDLFVSIFSSNKQKINKKYLEAFNKTFLCNLDSTHGYCRRYVKIDEICGNWDGVRQGKLIQEYEPLDEKKIIREFEF